MNPYFVLLVWLNFLASWLNFSFLARMALSALKNIRLILSLFVPEPKGSVEHLRGNILKIKYVDPQATHSTGFYLLAYANPPMTWTRARAITIEEYEAVEAEYNRVSQLELQQISASTQKFQTSASQTIDEEINELANTPITGEIHLPRKFNFRNYQHLDVTELLLGMAGPGKDFFGSKVRVHDLDKTWHTLIISYGKGLKIFHSQDYLTFQ